MILTSIQSPERIPALSVTASFSAAPPPSPSAYHSPLASKLPGGGQCLLTSAVSRTQLSACHMVGLSIMSNIGFFKSTLGPEREAPLGLAQEISVSCCSKEKLE